MTWLSNCRFLDGEKIAERTLNGRLGIVGGLSILGTTGIVVPYSCSAWIHSIHRGIDVARAVGLDHVAGATGATSEAAIARLYGLPEQALIDMGDFVGGMLKYLRRHPVPRVTVAGGMAKMTKLGQGLLDLHSRRGEVDLDWLSRAATAAVAGPNWPRPSCDRIPPWKRLVTPRRPESIFPPASPHPLCGRPSRHLVAGMRLDVVIFDRSGALLARSGH